MKRISDERRAEQWNVERNIYATDENHYVGHPVHPAMLLTRMLPNDAETNTIAPRQCVP